MEHTDSALCRSSRRLSATGARLAPSVAHLHWGKRSCLPRLKCSVLLLKHQTLHFLHQTFWFFLWAIELTDKRKGNCLAFSIPTSPICSYTFFFHLLLYNLLFAKVGKVCKGILLGLHSSRRHGHVGHTHSHCARQAHPCG